MSTFVVVCELKHIPPVLKTMCQVSPGASSPVILVLRRHRAMYGSLGLYLLVTTPSTYFFEIFSTLAGASVVTWALMETDLPLTETFLGYKLVCNNPLLSFLSSFKEGEERLKLTHLVESDPVSGRDGGPCRENERGGLGGGNRDCSCDCSRGHCWC